MEPIVSIPQTIFINLLLSHSRLGHEEFERNPRYNNQHYQYKASAAINAYLKEHEPETFKRFMERMSGPGPINEVPPGA